MERIKADETDKFLYKELSYKLVGAFYNVRNTYGSGQKELVYQNASAEELEDLGIPTGKTLGKYQLDFVVDGMIIVEVKAMKFTPQKIEQQLYSYLKSTPYQVGYLVNFGSSKLYLKRIIYTG